MWLGDDHGFELLAQQSSRRIDFFGSDLSTVNQGLTGLDTTWSGKRCHDSNLDDILGVREGDSNEKKNKAVTLYINGEQVASKDLGKIGTPRNSTEGLDVGLDRGTAVSTAYKTPYNFTGKIDNVVIDLK